MTTQFAGDFVSQDQLAALPLAEIKALPRAARRLPKVRAKVGAHLVGLEAMVEARRSLARQASAAGRMQEADRHFRAASDLQQEMKRIERLFKA